MNELVWVELEPSKARGKRESGTEKIRHEQGRGEEPWDQVDTGQQPLKLLYRTGGRAEASDKQLDILKEINHGMIRMSFGVNVHIQIEAKTCSGAEA